MMKPRQMFIVLVIILLATTLLFPKTKEERYCEQYSGESNIAQASDNYKLCESDDRCKVDKESILTKETDQDEISFICIPINAAITNEDSHSSDLLPK